MPQTNLSPFQSYFQCSLSQLSAPPSTQVLSKLKTWQSFLTLPSPLFTTFNQIYSLYPLDVDTSSPFVSYPYCHDHTQPRFHIVSPYLVCFTPTQSSLDTAARKCKSIHFIQNLSKCFQLPL